VESRSTRIETVGAGCGCAGFVRLKLNVYWAESEVSAASVIVSVPELCQLPFKNPWFALKNVRLPEDVLLPESPDRVRTGLPAAAVGLDWHVDSSGTLARSCTEIVFTLHGQGVLWLAVATPQYSGRIISGDPVSKLPRFELRLPAAM
jgi:hypothetical protein